MLLLQSQSGKFAMKAMRWQSVLIWIMLPFELFSVMDFMEPWWSILYWGNLLTCLCFTVPFSFFTNIFVRHKHEYMIVNYLTPFPNDAPEIKIPRMRCIHCEDIIILDEKLVQTLPSPLARCPYGVKTKFKEMLGFYNCVLPECAEEKE